MDNPSQLTPPMLFSRHMTTSRGFISLGLILAIIVIAALAGGGAWYASRHIQAPTAAQESTATTTERTASSFQLPKGFLATPLSGPAPLKVTFLAKNGLFWVDFGDGSSTGMITVYDCPAQIADQSGACVGVTHTYAAAGIFTAHISRQPPPCMHLGSCGNLTPIGEAKITVE